MTYDEAIDAWRPTWIGPRRGVVMPFLARGVGENIVLEGSFEEGVRTRCIFSEITPDAFSWRAADSKDDDASWTLLQEMKARRRIAGGSPMAAVPPTMEAIRLHAPGVDGLRHETMDTPSLQLGEALVEVHAAAITRDELEWPLDRLPAVPSYELSGVVAAVADAVDAVSVGDEVYALTPFDRDGVAAGYVAVPAAILAPKPSTLGHVESAAVPLPALSAWQGLFAHGGLEPGERVLVHGAIGGVGQFATQLARVRGAHVVATASPQTFEEARALGAHEVIDGRKEFDDGIGPVDLVFDTVGGELLRRAPALLANDGRLVSIAAEPLGEGTYFVVEPNRQQLVELARLVDSGELRVAIDSTFVLSKAAAAFERSLASGKHGKVVIQVAGDDASGPPGGGG
jgi:NADPH:quinone reductase-like Zn-dependent oxidoreductase